jgi:tRNA pseudouridine55 synthase
LDGLLVVDKPVGPSSHDVVARARRALGERRIGHTGTLDPEASGVLALLVGRATRLAQFLSADDKSYDAVVRLGVATNTYDAAGQPAGPRYGGVLPSREAIDAALDAFRGPFLQQPPAYSAKKVGGHPSYKLARRADRRRAEDGTAAETGAAPNTLAPAAVSTSRLEIVQFNGDCLSLCIDCSAGFYVRALAHDLGERLGTGGHLAALRRTRSGDATLAHAIPLNALEDAAHGRDQAAAALVPLSRMLPHLPAIVLTAQGVEHAGHGLLLGAHDIEGSPLEYLQPVEDEVRPASSGPVLVRLQDSQGNLLGVARPAHASGLLHPFVVLM